MYSDPVHSNGSHVRSGNSSIASSPQYFHLFLYFLLCGKLVVQFLLYILYHYNHGFHYIRQHFLYCGAYTNVELNSSCTCLWATQQYGVKSIVSLMQSWGTPSSLHHIALEERERRVLCCALHPTPNCLRHCRPSTGQTAESQNIHQIFFSTWFCCPASCSKPYAR